MKADYFVFDEWDTIERAEVEANKRRAKERVREAKSQERLAISSGGFGISELLQRKRAIRCARRGD